MCHSGSRSDTQKFNLRLKTSLRKFFHKSLHLQFWQEELERTAIFVFLRPFSEILAKTGKKFSNLPRICQHECNNISI